MAGQSKKTIQTSIRMPIKEMSVIDTYAAAHDLSRAQAILHYLRKGIAEDTGEKPATRSDLVAFAATIEKAIASQPIAIQESPQPLSLPSPETEELEKVKKMGWWEFWKWKKGSSG